MRGANSAYYLDCFKEWYKENPQVMTMIALKAQQMVVANGYVSVKYIFEWLRYESGVDITTPNGLVGPKLDNSWTSIVTRLLARDFPEVGKCLQMRPCDYTNEDLADVRPQWFQVTAGTYALAV